MNEFDSPTDITPYCVVCRKDAEETDLRVVPIFNESQQCFGFVFVCKKDELHVLGSECKFEMGSPDGTKTQ